MSYADVRTYGRTYVRTMEIIVLDILCNAVLYVLRVLINHVSYIHIT